MRLLFTHQVGRVHDLYFTSLSLYHGVSPCHTPKVLPLPVTQFMTNYLQT